MMPPTQPSMPTAGVPNTATNNNWQNPQQGYQNSNMLYQQQNTTLPHPQQQQHQQQQWPQQAPVQQTGTAAATYDNLFNHQQQQVSNNMYQQQQVPPVANYFQQSAPTTTAPPPIQSQQQQQPPPPPPPPQSLTNVSQTNAINFFDNANNNNPSTGGDGWGDWDWNDNSTIEATATNEIPTQQSPPQQQQPQPQQTQPLQQQLQPPANVANDHSSSQAAYNPHNIIADSFHQQNNDSWNWNTPTENEQNVVPPSSVVAKENNNNSSGTKMEQHNDNWNWTTNNDSESQQQQQQQTVATNDNTATNDNWNWQTNDTNQQQILAPALSTETPNVSQASKALEHHVAPPAAAAAAIQVATSTSVAPPPTEFSSNSVMENHNYNTNSGNVLASAPPTSASTNIPNTVFVSQAKPVTLPSRQYASPPVGNTPITENPPESALMPPQGFQNAEEATINRQANIPPAMATAVPHPPPGNAAPPPVGLPPAAAAPGNPFKRSGLPQHHRATGLMATVPTQTNVFNMPPPPPADFANPSSSGAVTLMEPENNELPSQENQEILTSPAPTMHHPQPSVSSITLPNASVVTTPASAALALPPPNDERNQYLQTSHLSENSEEQQPEADGLLPPPGLSRLVLGEPELEASQRMVMGTEAPPVVGGNTATVTDVMHLEERHADGEDTASENAVPVISTTIASGQGGKMSVLKMYIDVTKMISFFHFQLLQLLPTP